jgi:1-acyl-sn-glycerol-3-phosphate acyltransferase
MINEVENQLAYVLAQTYIRIPWNRIHAKNAHTFFMDRVKATSNSQNFKQFLDNLCLKVEVEFVRIPTEIINFLSENSSEVMRILRKECLGIVNYALDIVEENKKGGN